MLRKGLSPSLASMFLIAASSISQHSVEGAILPTEPTHILCPASTPCLVWSAQLSHTAVPFGCLA